MRKYLQVSSNNVRYKVYKDFLIMSGKNILQLYESKEVQELIKVNNIKYTIDCCNKSFRRSFYYINGTSLKDKSEFKKKYAIKKFANDFEDYLIGE